MSMEMRQWVVSMLTFQRNSQITDLNDESKTTTDLIEFLRQLLTVRGGVWQQKLVITAVNTDHPTIDGPGGHNGGNAIDYGQIDDTADLHLIEDTQACSQAKGIGLNGPYQQYAEQCGGYNENSKLFEDDGPNHIHVQVVAY